MDQPNEYLRNARECRAIAEKITSPETRADFLRMAGIWERLAEANQSNHANDDLAPPSASGR
jgi:hypothetical protein